MEEISEEAVSTALILEGKIVDRVRVALVEVFDRDGDHWILDSIRWSLKQVIEKEFEEREAQIAERILKLANPSR